LGDAKNTVLAYTLFLACQGKNDKNQDFSKIAQNHFPPENR
jgi:hypothetical protein